MFAFTHKSEIFLLFLTSHLSSLMLFLVLHNENVHIYGITVNNNHKSSFLDKLSQITTYSFHYFVW